MISSLVFTAIIAPKLYLDEAKAYSNSKDGFSFIVMVDGKTVAEDYKTRVRKNIASELASGTKSFAGVVAALMEEEGIFYLNDKVSDTITEWKSDPEKKDITISELLHLVSGLEGGPKTKPPLYKDAINGEITFPRNQQFQYGPTPFQVFGALVEKKLKTESYTDYLKRKVLDPIGSKYARWRETDGDIHIPSGAFFTASEWAKFGELVRLNGKWSGKQILPKDIQKTLFTGTKTAPYYGLTWWLPGEANARQLRQNGTIGRQLTRPWSTIEGIPQDVYMAAGMGNQRLYVIPSEKMVVVRQAPVLSMKDFKDDVFIEILFTGSSSRDK